MLSKKTLGPVLDAVGSWIGTCSGYAFPIAASYEATRDLKREKKRNKLLTIRLELLILTTLSALSTRSNLSRRSKWSSLDPAVVFISNSVGLYRNTDNSHQHIILHSSSLAKRFIIYAHVKVTS
jgi:hypothetical protein